MNANNAPRPVQLQLRNLPRRRDISLEPPTREMEREAVAAGFYRSLGRQRDYPRIQIVTVADLLRGTEVKMPPAFGTFKQARCVEKADAEQGRFDL